MCNILCYTLDIKNMNMAKSTPLEVSSIAYYEKYTCLLNNLGINKSRK